MSSLLPPAGTSPVRQPSDRPAPPEPAPPRADGGWRRHRVGIVVVASVIAGVRIGSGPAASPPGNGPAPCTGSCSSRWYAAGKGVALAASAASSQDGTGARDTLVLVADIDAAFCTASVQAAIKGNDTLVFVVDIRAAA